jgi:branched-chain amino acid aminotransferase
MIVSRGLGDVSYHFDRVAGPTVVIIVKPLEAFPESSFREGIDVRVVSVRRNSPRALDPAIKSCNLLNNVLAVREAQAARAEEAILLNDRDEVAEGASTNVFVVRAGGVATPPLSAGILAGITREVLLLLIQDLRIPVREETLVRADLLGAEEAFLTSSTREVMPIRSVDGHPVGEGRPGPVTGRILAAFRAHAGVSATVG